MFEIIAEASPKNVAKRFLRKPVQTSNFSPKSCFKPFQISSAIFSKFPLFQSPRFYVQTNLISFQKRLKSLGKIAHENLCKLVVFTASLCPPGVRPNEITESDVPAPDVPILRLSTRTAG